MIAEAPRDDAAAAASPAFEMILPRKLERRLDRFGAAAREPDAVERPGDMSRDQRGQFFGCLGREKAGVDILEPRGLLGDCRDDAGMAVAEAGNRGAAACIEIAPSLGVDQENSLSADRDRQPRVRRTIKNVAGGHYATLTFAARASMAGRAPEAEKQSAARWLQARRNETSLANPMT